MAVIHWLMDVVVWPASMLTLICVAPALALMRWVLGMLKVVFPKQVRDRVVVITGGSSGIGEAMAYEYARRGAKLVLAARRESRLRQNVDKCKRLGSPDAIYIGADVSREVDCRKIIDTAVQKFGRIDILVNNAGQGMSSFFEDIKSTDGMHAMMEVGFWGNVYTTHYALPHLRRARGQVVVMASVAGFVPYPRQSVYNAAKHADIGIYDTIRVEIGNEVDVSIVCPGFVRSEMTEKLPLVQVGVFPLADTDDAARAIVRGTLHRRRYVIVPYWYSMFLYWRIFAPEVMDWTNRVLLGGERGRKGVLEVVFEVLERVRGKAAAAAHEATESTKQIAHQAQQAAQEQLKQTKEAVKSAAAQAKGAVAESTEQQKKAE